MRKLSLSLFILLFAYWGQTLIRTGPTQGFVPIRDGLIILAVAGLLFALNARPQASRPAALATPWPWPGWLLAGIGFALSAGSAFLFAQQLRQGPGPLILPSILWLAGLLLFATGALWTGRSVRYPLPAFRWRRDAAGRPVRLVFGGKSGTEGSGEAFGGLSTWLIFGLILLGGSGLRLWQLGSAPAGCTSVECAVGLRILDWSQGRADLSAGVNSVGMGLTVLGSLLFGLVEPGTTALRWLTALLGILTLPLLFGLGQRLIPGPGGRAGGLMAMLLLAVNPLHIWFSRSTTPLALAGPLVALHLWASVRAIQERDRRWFALSGLSWGLLFVEAAPFRLFLLIWAALWLLLALISPGPSTSRSSPLGGMFAAAALTAALPGLVIGQLSATLLVPLPPLQEFSRQLAHLISTLLQPGGLLDTTGIPDRALLDPITATFGAVGLGLLAGGLVRRRAGSTVAVGFVLLAAGILRLSPIAPPPAAFLLVLMPLALAAAAAGIGEVWGQFNDAWGKVVSPRNALAVLAGLGLIGGMVGGVRFVNWLGDTPMPFAEQNVIEAALGRYLAQTLAADPNVRILAPGDQLDQPATRLGLAGVTTDPARLIPLDPGRHLPFAGSVTGDLIYVISNRNPALLDLLQQVYPAGSVEAHDDTGLGPDQPASDGAALFLTYRVPVSALEAAQGIRGQYFAGRDFGTDAQPQLIHADGPLRFDWAQQPPLPRPFSVVWQGSLLVRQHGPHTFRVDAESMAPGVTDGPVFSLEIDGVLLVDTSMGQMEKEVDLASGLYHLVLAYRSGTAEQPPTDLVVTWTPPNGETATVPRDVLYSVVLPDRGLLGSYYASSDWEQGGPLTDRRKDQVIGPDRENPQNYSVIWQGKLAAPMAGSYLLATVSDGISRIVVDGQPVVDNQAGPDTQFSQGSVSLAAGWHDLEIRYAPGATQAANRQFEFSWQPPEGLFNRVDTLYLAPLTAQVPTDGLVLPPAPVVTMPQVQPQLPQPQPAAQNDGDIPEDLPILELSPAWQVGGQCNDAPLAQPRGVVVDVLGGRVYVADAGSNQVTILQLDDGTQAGVITSPHFQEPFDLALSASGELWVLDATAQATFRVPPASGQPELQTVPETSFYRPRGMDLNRAGLRYIADTGGARVVVLDPTGTVLGQLGGPDSALGAGQPVDVLFTESGNLWVVTAEDGGLWRADQDRPVATLSRASSIDGPHLAGLPDSSFFLTEPEKGRVVYFSAQGQPLGQVRLPDQPSKPVGVDARLYDGQIYLAVSDVAGCRVSLYVGVQGQLP
ncbi:MAG: glycosyltransferase family 39 protein [Caldilineaceae bacterium]|nr:glycosyltransferase family 39 protein [Caldilineaceae bacterium]MBP8106766.1 glycosyltransferase family 39 protein [Caldilineaceae bacterium]MBP8121006.1 glycosyltransferase family 39 protein [Caldilineaceae bacterium]MBP9071779.1 glycosyltransferase family 39 protein [Caldilineaceae bacterium]